MPIYRLIFNGKKKTIKINDKNFALIFGTPGGSTTPEETSYMYYGRVSSEERGGPKLSYSGITESMIKNSTAMKQYPCSTIGKTSVGKETTTKAYDYIVVAVPKSKNYTVTMDNGIGEKVEFDEEYAGANGLPIKIDNIDYLLYGVTILSQGEVFIYID